MIIMHSHHHNCWLDEHVQLLYMVVTVTRLSSRHSSTVKFELMLGIAPCGSATVLVMLTLWAQAPTQNMADCRQNA